MATDVAGHTVPGGSDYAARKSLLDLSLTVPGTGIKTVASEAAANLYVSDLASALSAAGLPPISAGNPVYVSRADQAGVLWMHDGTSWTPLGDVGVSAGITGVGAWTITPVHARRSGRLINLVAGIKVASAAAFGAWQEVQVGTLPAGIRPAKDTSGFTVALQPGFQCNVKATGAITLQAGGAAVTFPTGSWTIVLQWAI